MKLQVNPLCLGWFSAYLIVSLPWKLDVEELAVGFLFVID